ncbi:AzlC family ABC transporter permease [Treponema sp. TIM-1]|uniref:AzlC family ABC transporter permease n=1 Tax=Treponema sp. TIM-1 TaxID=2898417 RepID=UPI003980D0C0
MHKIRYLDKTPPRGLKSPKSMEHPLSRPRICILALKYSVPVLLGYTAIGIAYGLLVVDAGYPWWLALVSSVVMFAGAGQYIAVGLFAAGASLGEACLVQLVVNARHIAYGLSLFKRIKQAGPYKYYLIFALSDETFALLSSLPAPEALGADFPERNRLMFYIALLDQLYWIMGTLIGAIAGTLIPFNLEGIGFSLTALFIVLMIEQILRLRRPLPFIISGLTAILGTLLLPSRLSLLSAMALSLVLVQIFDRGVREESPC